MRGGTARDAGAAACGGGQSLTITSPTLGSAQPSSPTGGGATTSGSAGSGQSVPAGLVGKPLDKAVSELDGTGLSSLYDPAIPGKEANRTWGVCSTTPPAGHSPMNGFVILHIRHLACGGGS